MEVDAISRSKIKEVTFSSTEPPSTNVLWAKPTGDKCEMFIFKNGSWVNIKDKEIDPLVKDYVDRQYAAIQEELKNDRKHVSDIAEDKDYKYTVVTKKIDDINLKSATKPFNVLIACTRPLITELSDKLRLKHPLLPTTSPYPTMRLEAIRCIIPISCRRYPKSVWNTSA